MKVKTTSNKKKFQQIEITITIESLEELTALMQLGKEAAIKTLIVDGGEVPESTEQFLNSFIKEIYDEL